MAEFKAVSAEEPHLQDPEVFKKFSSLWSYKTDGKAGPDAEAEELTVP